MAKQNVEKASKQEKKSKKNTKVRRTVLGTLSGVFMASAIIVAAIPVKDVQATKEQIQVSSTETIEFTDEVDANPDQYIPSYNNDTKIFFNENGLFGVARVNRNAEFEGVLVYYDNLSTNAPSSLVIPDSIDAYQYDGYDLRPVYQDKGYLSYLSAEEEQDVSGNTISPAVYTKCYASNYADWAGKTLYDDSHNEQTQLKVDVRYIGSQRFEVEVDGDNIKTTYKNDGVGIFEGARNFSSLTIPDHILAIGNNAFRDCQMTSVSIANKILSIGNHAFDGCNRMNTLSLANNTDLIEIGSYAFANCVYLSAVSIPDQVVQIGSGCFMNDTGLSAANLYGSNQDGNCSLNKLGDGVFFNCNSLGRMSLPNNITNISDTKYLFRGCTNLTYLAMPNVAGNFSYTNVTACCNLETVKVPNRNMTFDCNYQTQVSHDGSSVECTFGKKNLGVDTPFDDYAVSDSFSIICYRNSPAYKYACVHEYSVGYLDQNYEGQYERVKNNYFYTVNDDNELVRFGVYDDSGNTDIVELPDHVGSHYISTIDSSTFQNYANKEDIKYLYIPATVETIGDNAFNGCINLQEVEFADALAIQSIGSGAFDTNTTVDSVQLRFVGDVGLDSIPYCYAMNTANNYNDSSLGTKYISYTSSFPTNLTIELVTEKDPISGEIIKAVPTLVDAPHYDDEFSSASSGGGSCTYSLAYVSSKKAKQNAIVASAYAKYHGQSGADVVYSEDEQGVIDSVFKATIPNGVYGINDDVYQGDQYLTTAVLNSVIEVPDNSFSDCASLRTFIMRASNYQSGIDAGVLILPEGTKENVGDYAFKDDDLLENVTLSSDLEELGKLPFYDCDKLTNVDFASNPDFETDNCIIYQNLPDGTQKIIECLKTRGVTAGTGKVHENEVQKVSVIDPYAFEGCEGITQVYFGEAPLNEIPESCFENCTRLNYCEVSPKTKIIGDNAFHNTALSDIKIPSGVNLISDNAFTVDDGAGGSKDIQGMNIQCEVPSTAYEYATKHGFGTEDRILHKYTVKFYNYEGTTVLKESLVEEGSDAVPPEEIPTIDGMIFVKWLQDYTDVSADLNVYPQYRFTTSEDTDTFFTVTFYDYEGTTKLSIQKVPQGGSATPPSVTPERDGYTFTGWLPEYNNIQMDLDVYPQYKTGTSSGNSGDNGSGTNNGTNSGTNSGTDANTNNGASNTSTTPTANTTANTNTTTGTTTDKNTTTNNTNSGTNNGSSSGTNSGSSTSTNSTNKGNGTTVQVNKTGLTNPNLVTANVSGSSENFIVKISDSDTAKAAVEQALLNEFGSLENIRYFAMDISLYDSTGTTKIENYDGVSVTITMPIPDGLVSYGGNNKAGAVINTNTLEKLDAKFTTIDGVPCISFVAKHFSPYVIYADLDNLSASATYDATPTTGDPIHPKWFLCAGLAILSIVTFCLKGSKKRIVKVIPN